MAKKATTKTVATGTMGSTGLYDPTSGGGNDTFGGTEDVPNDPTTAGTTTEAGGTTPTGRGGTSGLSDTSFGDEFGVKKKTQISQALHCCITWKVAQGTFGNGNNANHNAPPRQANMHTLEETVNNLSDYTIMNNG